MRIKGRKLDQPNVEIVIIPRGNDQDIIFKAQAVLDHKQFEEVRTPFRNSDTGGISVSS